MSELRITSVRKPFDDSEVAREAVRALTRAEAMGLLGKRETPDVLDLATIRRVARDMSAAGIASGLVAELDATKASEPRRLAAILRSASEALDASPLPDHEWSRLLVIFGAAELGELVGVSPASVRRYAGGARTTPDGVAARLHFLALVVGELIGAYNEIGIRRWFRRARTALDGRAPAKVLEAGWDPEDSAPRKVRELAAALLASPAT